MRFGSNFLWGAATSAYQIEGAFDKGNRGLSVWDTFCRRPGAVLNGETGEIACDHYHRLDEDVAVMSELGLQAYRFSFSWSRVLPDGVGKPSADGLGFYDRLIDKLLDKGIEPFATIFHWDYPYELYTRGGWLNADSPAWFADYTRLLADRFSDRVANWFTLNEPSCFLGLGHVDGVHAPGLKLDWPDFFLATKHALLAHGESVRVLRAHCQRKPMIAIAPVSSNATPAEETPECIEAAWEFTFGVPDKDRKFWNQRFYLDPVLKGEWPEDAIAVLTPHRPKVSASELERMHQPLDALGLNLYAAPRVRPNNEGRPVVVSNPPGHPRTGFDWSVSPEGLYWAVRFHHEEYGLPVYISENGLSSLDWVSMDGRVHDPQRIDFLTRYLHSLERAIQDGYETLGYFHWSLFDNFEWAEGYRHRFGLVHVDFETQKRTIKDSGHWYREVIRSNGTSLLIDPPGLPMSAAVKTI